MIPVDQEIVDPGKGDCLRACYASLLELPLDAVPNFIRHNHNWFNVLAQFLLALKWKLDYISGHYYQDETRYYAKCPKKYKRPSTRYSLNGFFKATVKSRTFTNVHHAVIIDKTGLVVHDPNPNKLYQDENIIKTNELISWDIITRIK